MFVLTWKENIAYVFEPDTFKPIRSHNYQGEEYDVFFHKLDGIKLIPAL